MDFAYTEEQNLLATLVERLHRDVYKFDRRKAIAATSVGWSGDLWESYAKLGLLGLPVTPADGGTGGSGVDLMIIMESIGSALALEPYLATAVLGGTLLSLAGSPMQKASLIEPLMAGRLITAVAHAEGRRGDMLAEIETEAWREGSGFRLRGSKMLVPHGHCADLLIVSARINDAPAREPGLSLFLVDPRTPGLSLRACRTIDGIGAADIALGNVTVAGEALLGPSGGAQLILAAAFDRAVAALCAEAVGIMHELNRMTHDHIQTRRQFGVPIGSFQVLQHRMVDMTIEYEHARSMAIHAALAVDMNDRAARAHAVSAAKVRIGRAGRFIGEQAIQLHGAMGMSDESIVSHYFKRLIAIEQAWGDEEQHLARFAATSPSVPLS